jgi:hypothetical protein
MFAITTTENDVLYNPPGSNPQQDPRQRYRVRSCETCGRPLWQANAKKKFCSDRCRQAARRRQKWDSQFAVSRSAGHPSSGLSRFAENSPSVSKAYKADFASRGIVGPRYVIDIEIGITDPPKPADPTFQARADALIATIPDDLSLPDFLRRT